MKTQTSIGPSPVRVLRAWLFRERAVRGPVAIELDVMDRQLGREEQAVAEATGEAHSIEQHLSDAMSELRRCLENDGIIDRDEARGLDGKLRGVDLVAHNHSEKLEGMA